MNNPGIKYTLQITGNPLIDSFLTHLFFGLATALVTAMATWLNSKGFHVLAVQDWLNANGFNIPDLMEWLIGTVVAVFAMAGTAVWAWINSRARLATAVQSGINLVTSGAAVTVDGQTKITAIGDPTAAPPLPVTPAAAIQIVKNFGKPNG